VVQHCDSTDLRRVHAVARCPTNYFERRFFHCADFSVFVLERADGQLHNRIMGGSFFAICLHSLIRLATARRPVTLMVWKIYKRSPSTSCNGSKTCALHGSVG